MNFTKSVSSIDKFALLHAIILPALIIITAYQIMTGISFAMIAAMILVIIGFQIFFSFIFASARKKMPTLMLVIEPLVALAGVLIIFLIINK